MYTKENLNNMFSILAESIDISDELFDDAVKEYKNLGSWLDKQTPQYSLCVYPQGSFALGTVVKPITEKDDYDLDLVCELAEKYNLSARQLKIDVIKPLLIKYRRITGDIIEKRRCWHVDYEELPSFHIDVIPSFDDWDKIQITDHDEENGSYSYIPSNPKGYIDWFFERRKIVTDKMYNAYIHGSQAPTTEYDIERIKKFKIKTPLQRSVQLLKRHRDIAFDGKQKNLKPISIIITTIAGQLYNNEDNIYDAIYSILSGAEKYIFDNIRGGLYYISNPRLPSENFADKWNEHPERADAFIKWIRQAREDFVSNSLFSKSRIEMANHVKRVFGMKAGTNLFTRMAERDYSNIKSGTLKVDTQTGSLSKTGTILVPENHHHGI